jgi:hypothetical protein
MLNLQEFLSFSYHNLTVFVEDAARDPYKKYSHQLFTIPSDYPKFIQYIYQIASQKRIPQLLVNSIQPYATNRQKESVHKLTAIVIDEATTISNIPFKPHFVVETSPDKFQHWFILNPVQVTEDNAIAYTALVHSMGILAGSSEPQNGISKLVRIPFTQSFRNNTNFLTKLVEDNSGLLPRYFLEDLLTRIRPEQIETPLGLQYRLPRVDKVNGRYPKGTRDIGFIQDLSSILLEPELTFENIESRLNQWVIDNLEAPEDFLTGADRANLDSKIQKAQREYKSLRPESKFEPVHTEVAFIQNEILQPTFPRIPGQPNHFDKAPGAIGTFCRKFSNLYPHIPSDISTPVIEQFFGVLASYSSFISNHNFDVPPVHTLVMTADPGAGKSSIINILSHVLNACDFRPHFVATLTSSTTPQGILESTTQAGSRALLIADDAGEYLQSALHDKRSLATKTMGIILNGSTAFDNPHFEIDTTKSGLQNPDKYRGLPCPVIASIIFIQEKLAIEHVIGNDTFLNSGQSSRTQVIVTNRFLAPYEDDSSDDIDRVKILADLLKELDTNNFITKANSILTLRYKDLTPPAQEDDGFPDSSETIAAVNASGSLTPSHPESPGLPDDMGYVSTSTVDSPPKECPEEKKRGRPKGAKGKKHIPTYGVPLDIPVKNKMLPEHLQSKLTLDRAELAITKRHRDFFVDMRNSASESDKNYTVRLSEQYKRSIHLYMAWGADCESAAEYANERVLTINQNTLAVVDNKAAVEADELSPADVSTQRLLSMLKESELGIVSFRDFRRACPKNNHRLRPRYNQSQCAESVVRTLLAEGLITVTLNRLGKFNTIVKV